MEWKNASGRWSNVSPNFFSPGFIYSRHSIFLPLAARMKITRKMGGGGGEYIPFFSVNLKIWKIYIWKLIIILFVVRSWISREAASDLYRPFLLALETRLAFIIRRIRNSIESLSDVSLFFLQEFYTDERTVLLLLLLLL